MSLNRKQLSLLQQALWKIEAATTLVNAALGGTDVGDDYASRFNELMEDLVGDLAENSEMVD